MKKRDFPNILVTGTPGTGKTTLCETLCEAVTDNFLTIKGVSTIPLVHVKVGDLIKDDQLYTEWDDELNVPIFDEDLVLSHLEPILTDDKGGKIVDFHSAEFFPPEWFDLIIILQTRTDVLYDRLEKRGYATCKIQENVQCEIFQTILQDAKEQFGGSVEIWERENNKMADLNSLVETIVSLLKQLVS